MQEQEQQPQQQLLLPNNNNNNNNPALLQLLRKRETIAGINLAKGYISSYHAWQLCETISKDPKFQNELGYGKYARFAQGWPGRHLYAILKAVDEWGRCCDSELEIAVENDDDEYRREALQRVLDMTRTYRFPVKHQIDAPELVRPMGHWASHLTASDVYGILWLARGMGCRQCEAVGGIGKFSPRARDCVQPLLDVVHGKSAHYQVAGAQIPFSTPIVAIRQFVHDKEDGHDE